MTWIFRHTAWSLRAVSIVLFSACVLMQGCASTPKKAAAGRTDQHLQQAISALKKASDADSLAAAALLSLEGHADRAGPLIDRAVAKSPGRVDLVWLELQVCQATVHCNQTPIENRLRSLDSSNGYGWMGALARATVAKDDAAAQAALAMIGRSERFDIYWTSLNARLALAVIRTKRLTSLEAQQTVMGDLVTRVLPAYGVLTAACKGEHLTDAATLEACRGVAHSLQNGDTYLTEMIGVQIAENTWPENSPAWQAAELDRKQYEYTSSHWVKITGGLGDATMAEHYLLLCAQYHREQEVWRAQLIDAGENPDPPAQ